MNYDSFNSADLLAKMKKRWVCVAFIKLIICILSLQLIIGSSLPLFFLFGFTPPILAMVYYIYKSYKETRRDPELLQVLGDSTYYLGFLFTVLSIVAAMADLGFGDLDNDTMKYIASRFALAMITTVFGMGIRAYIVTFELKAITDEDTSTDTQGTEQHTLQVNGNAKGQPGAESQATNDDQLKHKPEQPSTSNKPQNTQSNQKYIVDLVINAISDDEVFKQLQGSMNKAIHDFNELANNAYTVRAALEGSASTLVERTGEHLQKATEEMTQKALNGISETISKSNKLILDNLEQTTADNQKALIQLRETNLQLSKEAADNVVETAQAYQQSLDKLLSDFTQSLKQLQQENTQISKDNLATMTASVQQIAPIIDTATQTLLRSAQSSHASLEKSATAQMQVLSDLNNQLIKSGETLNQNVHQVSSQYNALGSNFDGLAQALKKLDHDFTQITRGVTHANSLFGDEISTLKQHSEDLVNISKTMKLSTDSYNQLKSQLESIRAALTITSDQYARLQSGFMDNAQKTSAMVEQLSTISEQLSNNATKFNGGIDYLNTELGKTSDALLTTVQKYEQEKQSRVNHKPWWKFWK